MNAVNTNIATRHSAMFINKKVYTDVSSVMLFDIDMEKGTALAVRVEKEIDLKNAEFHEGGFSGHFSGTEELYRDSQIIKELGEPEAVIIRNGSWVSRTPKDVIWEHSIYSFTEDGVKSMQEDGWVVNGDRLLKPELTKAGRVKKYRNTYGKVESMTPKCCYFVDYNF